MLVVSPRSTDVEELAPAAVETVIYAAPHWWQGKTRVVQDVSSVVSAFGPKVVHAVDAQAGPLADRVAESLPVPLFVSSYSLADLPALRKLNSIAGVVAPSEAIHDRLAGAGIVSEDRLHLIRPGIATVRHATCFQTLDDVVGLAACGPLQRTAPFVAVLEAFNQLDPGEQEVAFFLIGRGRGERKLRRIVCDLGLAETMTFVDREDVSHFGAVLRGMDVFISPVVQDSYDFDCLQAMSAGLPVVVSADSPADFAIDGETALTYNAARPSELARKLSDLLQDRVAARKLAESALDYLRKNHGPHDAARAMANLYRTVSGAGGTASAGMTGSTTGGN